MTPEKFEMILDSLCEKLHEIIENNGAFVS